MFLTGAAQQEVELCDYEGNPGAINPKLSAGDVSLVHPVEFDKPDLVMGYYERYMAEDGKQPMETCNSSDFTFYREGAGDWFDESLLIESVWTDPETQDAWVEMWRHTANATATTRLWLATT